MSLIYVFNNFSSPLIWYIIYSCRSQVGCESPTSEKEMGGRRCSLVLLCFFLYGATSRHSSIISGHTEINSRCCTQTVRCGGASGGSITKKYLPKNNNYLFCAINLDEVGTKSSPMLYFRLFIAKLASNPALAPTGQTMFATFLGTVNSLRKQSVEMAYTTQGYFIN